MNIPEGFNPKRTFKCLNDEGESVYYWEVFFCQGPEIIGDEKDGTITNLYGKLYMLEVREDGTRKVYRKEDDEWFEIVDGLEVFDPSGNHYTMAFDQAATYVGAAEYDGEIKVISVGISGTQEFTFSGVNPVLLADSTINKRVAGSDVVCFYQKSDDLSKIYTRIQRDDYAIERLLITHTEDILIDRVIPNSNRYTILATDSNGEKFVSGSDLEGFVSDLYPTYLYASAKYSHEFSNVQIDDIGKVYGNVDLQFQYSHEFLDVVVDSTVIIISPNLLLNYSHEFLDVVVDTVVVIINPLLVLAYSYEYLDADLVTVGIPYNPGHAIAYSYEYLDVTITTA